MSDVRSLLTAANRKELSQLLGKVNLHLLYKATVHGFDGFAFHSKCDKQGPTITIGYNKSGFIFGGYRSTDFGDRSNQVKSMTFVFRIPSEGKASKYAVNKSTAALWSNQQTPNFGRSLLYLLDSNVCNFLHESVRNFLAIDDEQLIECEAYRVEEVRAPWRHLTWTTGKRREQMKIIESYKPYMSSVSKARILLIGPIGAGKSSFINSVNSIFRGHVTNRVLAGSGPTSITTMYSTYSFRGGKDDASLPFILCDTMGIGDGEGILTKDIISIIKGHVPNKYEFKTASPINPDTADYIKSPTVGERIHCVVYVIDVSKFTTYITNMKEKICAIRSEINKLEVPQIVLLTKVDAECPVVAENLENVYHSNLIEKKVLDIGQQVGIPISCIIPMKNYWSDHELNDATDVLILSALVQILRYADDHFENLQNSPS